MNGIGADCTLIITMAGVGRRFKEAGFEGPKYRLQVKGRSLFAWSQTSLLRWVDAGARFVFIALAGEEAGEFIAEQCRALGIIRFEVLEIDQPTDGQATTALMASEYMEDLLKPVAVYNIDTFVEPDWLSPFSVRGHGWIPCFPGKGAKWSFARIDAGDRVLELQEKNPISPHATVGFYWFSSFALFQKAYEAYYLSSGSTESRERYVAPLYNQLITWGYPCYVERLPAPAVVCLGTPGDVEAFESDTQ